MLLRVTQKLSIIKERGRTQAFSTEYKLTWLILQIGCSSCRLTSQTKSALIDQKGFIANTQSLSSVWNSWKDKNGLDINALIQQILQHTYIGNIYTQLLANYFSQLILILAGHLVAIHQVTVNKNIITTQQMFFKVVHHCIWCFITSMSVIF